MKKAFLVRGKTVPGTFFACYFPPKRVCFIQELIMIAVKSRIETIEDCAYGDDCPLHTENPPFNAKVLAAVAESRAIMRGDISAKKYNSLEEARKDLGV
jgi:hypothetical protein